MTDWTSLPLKVLLDDIGEAVVCLNTVVVGLDAVEKGHEKPETLDISWSPADSRAAARKSRKFIVEAVLVRVFEALFNHCQTICVLPRFGEVSKQWDSNTTRATKIWTTYQNVLGDHYLVSSATLVAHWRNRIVHPKSNARLDSSQKGPLRQAEQEIAENYKGLKVDCLLCHFEEGRPTLKDVSSLIAMAINLARKVDAKIASTLAKDDLDAWLNKLDLFDQIEKVRLETKPNKRAAAIRRVFKAHAPALLGGYEKYYTL